MTFSAVGVDIGGTNFRLGSVSPDGEVDCFVQKSSEIFSAGYAPDILFTEISEYLSGIPHKIKALAIGLPSIVSKDKKTVVSTPNIKGFDNLPLADSLSHKLGIPVFLDRDVNYLMRYDIRSLSLDTSGIIVGFYIGTGLGNSIFINAQPFTGKNGAAGELGHIPLYGVEGECTCGNIGCSELRCSGRYLEKIAAEKYPDTPIKQIFVRHGNDEVITEYVKGLAIPLATEINILDPDFAVIAGGVPFMEGFPQQLLLDSIRQSVRKPYPSGNLVLLFSKHTQQSGVIGGGLYAYDALERG